jgi:hypothetical protein
MHTDTDRPAPARRTRKLPGERLRAALLVLAGGHARLLRQQETGWASITFSGTRHALELAFEGAEAVAAGETFIVLLPEHEFAIPGQLVADANITEVDHQLDPPALTIRCELLLLEES